jgi:hypothetical protein
MGYALMIAAAVGIALFLHGAARAVRDRLREGRRERHLRGVPRVPIALAGEGRVTCVIGDLVGPPPLVAPLTGRPCFYWELEIQHGDDVYWTTRVREVCPSTTFTIRDDSGRAVVDCAGAEVACDRSAGQRIVDREHRPDDFVRLLTRHGLPTAVLARGRFRCIESALTADDPIAVVGMGVHEPDPDGSADAGAYRDGPPTILHLGSTPAHRLHVTDSPLVTAA